MPAINQIRANIQDTIHATWTGSHPAVPLYFENRAGRPGRVPYLFSRMEFGTELRASIGAESGHHRLRGVILFVIYTNQETTNQEHDSYIDTIRGLHLGQMFRPSGILTRGLSVSGGSYKGDQRSTILSIPFQVDTFTA